MASYAPPVVILCFAILDWLAVWYGWQKVKYATKPLVMLVLTGWILLNGGMQFPLLFFTMGVVFSLLGDVWLMLPGNFFLAGLVSFLLAHIVYIVGFFSEPVQLTPVWIVISILMIIAAVIVMKKIRRGVYNQTGARRLRWSVTVYGIVITLMLLSALSTIGRSGWSIQDAVIISIGALFFYSSDTMLAYDRFVKIIPRGRFYVRITYHIGQLLLITGAVSHFQP